MSALWATGRSILLLCIPSLPPERRKAIRLPFSGLRPSQYFENLLKIFEVVFLKYYSRQDAIQIQRKKMKCK